MTEMNILNLKFEKLQIFLIHYDQNIAHCLGGGLISRQGLSSYKFPHKISSEIFSTSLAYGIRLPLFNNLPLYDHSVF